MIKDLINELKAIDSRLSPVDIYFKFLQHRISFIELVYNDLKVEIYTDKSFNINSYDDCTIIHHRIYDSMYTNTFDLLMLLYNNKDKITEIVLKYL